MHKASIRYLTLRLSLRLSTGIAIAIGIAHMHISRRSRIFLKGGPFSVKEGADCNYWVVGPTAHIG